MNLKGRNVYLSGPMTGVPGWNRDARSRRVTGILQAPLEAWVDVWDWFGDVAGSGDDDLVDFACRTALRVIWVLVTLALIPWLWISLIVGM